MADVVAAPSLPNLYIVARVLERLWEADAPMLRTHLQMAANVNYDVFSRYLDWMVSKALVTFEDNPGHHAKVVLTAKGRNSYLKLVQWINEVVHNKAPGLV